MILKKINNQFINVYYYFKYFFIKKNMFKIMPNKELVDRIINEKKSLCRFGDGELRSAFVGVNIGFQENNVEMQSKLRKILLNEEENSQAMIGLYDTLNSVSGMTRGSKIYWIKFMVDNYDTIIKRIPKERLYASTNITRPYMDYKNKSKSVVEERFGLIKKIWNKKDVVMVEGEFTRLGIGNDLFDNCNTIKRIICPAQNAFSKYDEIYNSIKNESKEKLFLIALGPTTTILAYELSKEGYQCIDIGHIDIEYMWFKKGCKNKEKIMGKYVNEVNQEISNFCYMDDIYENEYIKQIIKRLI